jgi:hypothetical protein
MMKVGLEALLEAGSGLDAPLLVHVALHSWSLSKGVSSEERLREFLGSLREMDGACFAGAKEVYELWDESGYEPYYLNTPDLLGPQLSLISPERHFRLSRFVLSWLKRAAYHITGFVD